MAETSLTRSFFLQDAVTLAPQLLGKVLTHRTPEGTASGRIVEVEAYAGPEDKGAHSFGGRRTARTEVLYGPGGFAYVYLIYGFHSCFNVVADLEGRPQVVFIRALQPVEGIDLMRRRRGVEKAEALCSGPGKLCAALGITREQYGLDLLGDTLFLEDGPRVPPEQILCSPRVNIDYAEEYREKPWRFYLKDSPFVSKVPKRFSAASLPFTKYSKRT